MSPNPFEPPRSEIGSDRAAEPRWRRRALLVGLWIQLALGSVGLRDLFETGMLDIPWSVLALVIHVGVPAVAIWSLLRRARLGPLASLISGALLLSLTLSAPYPAGAVIQLIAVSIIALSAWLIGRQFQLRRSQ